MTLPTREQIEELRGWDDALQKWYGPNDEKPNLIELRGKISMRLHELMPSLLTAAEQAIDLQARLADLLNSGGDCGHAKRFFVNGECLACLSWSLTIELCAAERELAALKARQEAQ